MIKLLILITVFASFKEVQSADVLNSLFKELGNYSDDAANNKTYYLSRHLKGSFLTAQSFCKTYDMNLAALSTLDEYNNFKNIIVKNNPTDMNMELFFVGGTRIGAKNWYWLPSGIDLDYKLNWGPDEPNHPSTEQCLSFYVNNGVLKFNDMTCEAPPIRFICEKFLKVIEA